jgi:Rrf2 family protein
MKISYKGDYALKALLELALNYEGEKVILKINQLAKKLDIPLKFLEAVLLTLKKGSFVKSKRGKDGGYYLARPPAAITLGEVVRYIEGPVEPIACVDDRYKGCKDLKDCAFRKVWQQTAKAISDVIDNVTLETLAAESKKRKEILNYFI